MRVIILAIILTIATTASSIQMRDHDFMDLLTKDPSTMLALASGDYLSLLPDFIEPHIRKLLGKEKKTGVAGFMQTAQGLLGGGGSGGSALDGLMGGQSAGSGISGMFSGLFGGESKQSGSGGGISSLLSGFTGGSKKEGGGGIGGLLSGLTGGSSEKKESSGGIGGMLSGLFHEDAKVRGMMHLRRNHH